jgi:multicomponent Na+:H+ antiporter subunit F
MHDVHVAITVLVLLGVLTTLPRAISGPTLMDRILAVNVIGTKTIVLLVLIGFVSGRPEMFIDVALAYALINFIATIAVLRYLEALARRRMEAEPTHQAEEQA